ncbi:S8 family serine peptidase [Sinomonas sp. JGH33]|uniref:S8 family serine peptidase n=2 Tax=Sinomonas terricola TaxID=3110330 RepID=A0ABU5T972_9MICC|nr:S8 family serine peptidase [Sinomonas sp. JGH33]MEA5456242.1 S8 family serine peptidase [Sinomonas sp. JGH33]
MLRRAARLLAAVVAACASVALAGITLLAPAVPAHADSIRDGEYWLSEYGIQKAWDVSKGAGVTVAVIDSGVNGGIPDLKGAVAGGTDASGAGQADGQGPIGSEPVHGTLVATVLAGRGHNPDGSPAASGSVGSDGIVGVAPQAQLLTVSTWLGSPNPAGRTDADQIPAAVRWAVDHGAKVINMSLGSSSPDWPSSWDDAFLYAEQKDVVVVAAAGNRAAGNIQVGAPATIPGVLTVAGLDRQEHASVDASSQGVSIGVSAPAEQLLGGLPDGNYAQWEGSSGATPIVAGVAALIRAKWPQMSAKQVINRIVSTAKDAGAPGHDPIYGYGVLDAGAALTANVPETTANPLGSIADWIRVHRRSAPATPGPSPTGPAKAPAEDTPLPEASVPVPAASADANPWPAVVVLGFGGLIAVILGGGTWHVLRLRRAADAGADGGGETGDGAEGEPSAEKS